MALRDTPTMLGFTVAGTLGLSRCWAPPPPSEAEYARGLAWLLPGVEGGPWELEKAYEAFRDAGVNRAIEVYDWSRTFGTLRNLVDYKRNREEAARIAGEIAEYRRAHPDAPIDLVGYSGGGGVAVMVAEALPDAVRVRNVILCQAAISPNYDLTAALKHVEGHVENFYSAADWLFLGIGTKLFGTMDRRYVTSAGKDGFDLSAAVPDPELRSRLRESAWTPDLKTAGHDGGHLGILAYEWNRRCVAPLLLAERAVDPTDRVRGASPY